MTKVMITSVSTGGSGGEDKLTENVSLNFARGEAVDYIEQNETGEGEWSRELQVEHRQVERAPCLIRQSRVQPARRGRAARP